jgi:hypothetical protein
MTTTDLAVHGPLRTRGRRLLAATFVLALLRVAPVDAAETPESLAVDEYAKRFEVSEEEAGDRLALQGRAAGIANALEHRLGSNFAGVWFDNADGTFVVPIVATEDRAEVEKQFAEYGLGEEAHRTTLVESTIFELEVTQARMAERARGLLEAGRVRSGLDPSRNEVVFEIAADVGAGRRAELRAQAAAEPARVRFFEADPSSFDDEASACTWNNEPRRACDPPFHGGVEIFRWITQSQIESCTAGFAATGNSFGNTFVMTAGHCLANPGAWWAQTANGYTNELGNQEGYFYANGNADAGIIRVKSNNWWVANWGWRGHIVMWGPPGNPAAVQLPSWPIYGSQSSYVGENVCHSGRTSGSSCGTVKQLNTKVTYGSGYSLSNMTKVEGICGDLGDSGGPVWGSYNYAVGIWSGGQNGSCSTFYYTEAREVESVFGVHVTPW